MTKPMIRVHDTETDSIVDREMTDDELAQYQSECASLENAKPKD